MLAKQTISKNVPHLVRCLSSSTHLYRSIPVMTGSKKLPEKLKGKPTPEERNVFSRTKSVAGVKKQDKSSPSKNEYLPLSLMPKLPKHLEAKEEPVGVDLEIPMKYIMNVKPVEVAPTKETRTFVDEINKTMKQSDNDKKLISISNMIAQFMDPDPNKMFTVSEHPLKRSLSGISKMNPGLNKIKDEYLWNIIPEENMFGVPPYQKDEPLGFEKWEKNFIEEKEKNRLQKETDQKEYEKFLVDLNASESFVSSKGTRKKIDRKLLKKYKKLKKDGKLPRTQPKFVITIED